MTKYAEDMNFWRTSVDLSKSQGEILKLLDSFGASEYGIIRAKLENKEGLAIRFKWQNDFYRLTFHPYPTRGKSNDTIATKPGGQRISKSEAALRQMGRIAVTYTKGLLLAADYKPETLFSFKELPYPNMPPNILPPVAHELDIKDLPPLGDDDSSKIIYLPSGD